MISFVCAIVAAAPAAWAAAMFLWPPFPRMFGRQAVLPGSVFAGWSVTALFLVFGWPELRWLVALAGAGLGMLLLRGWLAAWSAEGPLPPGTMSFRSGVRALADRSFYGTGFTAWGPIFKTTQFGAPVICVFGIDRVGRLLRGHARQLGPSPLAFNQSIMGSFLRYMDDETHARYGPLFRRAMAGAPSADVSMQLRARCRGMLEAWQAAGVVSPAPALRTWAREALDLQLFGFAADDADGRRFGELADRFRSGSLGASLGRAERQLLEDMVSLLVDQLERLAPEDVDAPVLARLRRLDRAMPDRICLDNLVFMHRIATANVSSLLLWLLYYWATEAEAVARLRELPPTRQAEGLDAFLSETLRLSQSEYLYRRVEQEFTFEGVHFPAGWMVRSCIWESHRFGSVLPDPTEFRLRLNPGDYDRGHHAPFGMDRHACNGTDLNRAICTAFLGELAAGYAARVENAQPFRREMRHWSHWQPNPAMTVQLRPVA